MNTVLSCAPSTQFHLGTDVRYHYVPKYTVFHVFQDCGPLEGASKLKFSAATWELAQGTMVGYNIAPPVGQGARVTWKN